MYLNRFESPRRHESVEPIIPTGSKATKGLDRERPIALLFMRPWYSVWEVEGLSEYLLVFLKFSVQGKKAGLRKSISLFRFIFKLLPVYQNIVPYLCFNYYLPATVHNNIDRYLKIFANLGSVFYCRKLLLETPNIQWYKFWKPCLNFTNNQVK